MVGKAQIILVLGFALIFMMMGYLWSDLSSRSVDNQVDYYKETIAHNLAVSGANMALHEIFVDQSWTTGINDLQYFDGEINANVTVIDSDNVVLTSVGEYMNHTHTVKVKLKKSNYAKFAWYIGNASSKDFITGDTVWGPFHSQSFINIAGNPAFFGKVTTLKGIKPTRAQMIKNGYSPYFSQPPLSGVDIPYPNNYQFVEQKASAIAGGSHFASTDMWLTFEGENITYRFGTGDDSSTYSAPITVPLTTFAPTGVIYLAKGDLYMSGTLNGQVSVVAGEASGLGNGNVYLVGDMVYESTPMVRDGLTVPPIWTPTSSDDMMGIMTTNNVIVATSAESGGQLENVQNQDININAMIFCAQGGVQLQDYNSVNQKCGTFHITGGVVAAKEELIAKLNNKGVVTAGYERYVVFDERFLLDIPPDFPPTGLYEVISWLE